MLPGNGFWLFDDELLVFLVFAETARSLIGPSLEQNLRQLWLAQNFTMPRSTDAGA